MTQRPIPSATRVASLVQDEYTHVMVLSTARHHGHGPQRLPDRMDRGRRIAAVQVESDAEACAVLQALDQPGRRFYVDVERKQDLHLVTVARDAVRFGSVSTIKPNDLTVDAFESVVMEHAGFDLSDVRMAIYGTGNLAFKFALRMAERSAQVSLFGRDTAKVARIGQVINEILPAYAPHKISTEIPNDGAMVLASAVTAEAVITPQWLGRLASHAVCIDVGINNFSPTFIEQAQAAGHICMRLDVRSAGDPLPVEPNPFFREIAGRRELEGIRIVAGGHLGELGDVVVDQVRSPTLVVGIANGTGGLLPADEWSTALTARADSVRRMITERVN